MTSALGASGGKPGICANPKSNLEPNLNRRLNSVQCQASTPLRRGRRGPLEPVIFHAGAARPANCVPYQPARRRAADRHQVAVAVVFCRVLELDGSWPKCRFL